MLSIKNINSESKELDIIRNLFREYSNELNEDLCFQSFEDELHDPLKKYGGPHGALLLAYWNDLPAGCIALQPLQNKDTCEMKRLYVRPAFRRFGIGGELVKILLREAKEKGFKKMVLDTLERLQPAIQLYIRHGFTDTSAYYQNPLSKVVYLGKQLL